MRIFGTCIAILALTGPALAGSLSGRWETDAENCLQEPTQGQRIEFNSDETELTFLDHSTEGGTCLIHRVGAGELAAACRWEEGDYLQTTFRVVAGAGDTIIVSSDWLGRGFTTYHYCLPDIGYGE